MENINFHLFVVTFCGFLFKFKAAFLADLSIRCINGFVFYSLNVSPELARYKCVTTPPISFAVSNKDCYIDYVFLSQEESIVLENI